jgi:hypothetical protein
MAWPPDFRVWRKRVVVPEPVVVEAGLIVRILAGVAEGLQGGVPPPVLDGTVEAQGAFPGLPAPAVEGQHGGAQAMPGAWPPQSRAAGENVPSSNSQVTGAAGGSSAKAREPLHGTPPAPPGPASIAHP